MADPEVSHLRSSLPKICAVELPGQVVDTEEAVASIGGAEAVQQAMQPGNGRLRLRLCRPYKFQAPLPMKRHRTSDLLVRAKRLSNGAWEFQPVGIIQTSFKAEVLADFLFTPGAEMGFGASPVRGSIEEELSDAHPPGPLFIPPAYFTKVDTPQLYNFEENPFIRRQGTKEVKAITGTGEVKLQRAWIKVHQIKFSDRRPVPTAPPAGADDQLREDEKTIVEALRRLFSERSVWLRIAMEERLREEGLTPSVSTMQKCLMCTAYLCSDGPWRQAYAVLGFDPRLKPEEARSLQVIDFRDRFLKQRRAYFERIQGTITASPVAALDCHFRTPPVNRSQLYQLIDIEDEVIQETLSTCGCTDKVSEKFGWIPATSIKAIRERMAIKAELMHRARATGPSALEAPERRLALTVAAPAKQAATGSKKPRIKKVGSEASASEASALPAAPAAKQAATDSKKRSIEKIDSEASALEAPAQISALPAAPAAKQAATDSKKRRIKKVDPEASALEATKQISARPAGPAAKQAATDSKKRRIKKVDPEASALEATKQISARPAGPAAKKAATGSKKRRLEKAGPEASALEALERVSAPAAPAVKKTVTGSGKRRVEETDPEEPQALPTGMPSKQKQEKGKSEIPRQSRLRRPTAQQAANDSTMGRVEERDREEPQEIASGKSSLEEAKVEEPASTRRLRRLRRVAASSDEDG